MNAPSAPPRRGLIIGGAVAAVVVVAAAAVVALVLPRPAPAASPPVPRAAPVDLRRADLCSLLDPAPLQAYGAAAIDDEFGEYAACQITVAVPTGGIVLVTARFPTPLGPGENIAGAIEMRGDLAIGREAETDGSCDRNILLPDRTRLTVTAADLRGADTLVCTIAETATASAVARIEGPGIAERPPAVEAPNSLAEVDACALLDAPALAAVPEIAGATPEPGFADHTCRWGATPYVGVLLNRQGPVTGADGTPTVLAGRDALVLPGGYTASPASCLVQVLHREFRTASGEPRVEKLQIVYSGSDTSTPDEICAVATGLATSAAARLPPI